MAESIEERVSALERMCATMFAEQQSLRLLFLSLFLCHESSARVCGCFDFLIDRHSELALGEPVSDEMLEYVLKIMKDYQTRLPLMGEAMEQLKMKKDQEKRS